MFGIVPAIKDAVLSIRGFAQGVRELTSTLWEINHGIRQGVGLDGPAETPAGSLPLAAGPSGENGEGDHPPEPATRQTRSQGPSRANGAAKAPARK